MKLKPPSPLATVASVLVAALLITGTVVGWPEFLRGIKAIFEKHGTIRVQSPSRMLPENGEVFAGERLRFALEGVDADKVFWLIDEHTGVSGNVQTEYTFPYDSSAPGGTTSIRRVDAFYRVDDQYRSASRRVRVNNTELRLVARVDSNRIELTARTTLPGGWQLERAAVARYSEGKFSEVSAVPVIARTNHESHASGVFASEERNGTTRSLATNGWISLEYANPQTNQRYSSLRPLSPTLP